jgi:uncharacterized protein (TIGR01777 family)
MKLLITGGTGFLGSRVAERALDRRHDVTILTRTPAAFPELSKNYRLVSSLNSIADTFDGIINLAGMPLDEARWSDHTKQQLVQNRLDVTKSVLSYIAEVSEKPKFLLSGSAIGFYGHSTSAIFSENSAPGDYGFAHGLCSQWEDLAVEAQNWGVRSCLLRTGVVLDDKKGALAKMLPLFNAGLGATLGAGTQWLSWIHIEDYLSALETLMENANCTGPFNLTAPHPVTQSDFAEILAATLHRPRLLSIPAFAVRSLFGQMGTEILLQGQNVIPSKLIKEGFSFEYPTLEKALDHLVRGKF